MPVGTRGSGGAVSANATRYSPGSILVLGATLVRARALNRTGWSALNEAAFIPMGTVPADRGNLAITELHYHPVDPSPAEILAGFTDDDFEFIELTNISNTDTIDLSSVHFATGVVFEFPASTTLAPGEQIVVVRNQPAFQLRYPGVAGASIAGEFHSPGGVEDAERLSNGGEKVVLLDAGDGVIADITYNDSDPWPKDADGGGSTLVLRRTSGSYNDGLNWRASVVAHGTPGTSDSVPYTGGDLIDYALADPRLTFTFTASNRVELTCRLNLAADDGQISLWRSPNLQTWAQVDAEFKVDRRQNFGDGTVETEFQSLDPASEVLTFYQLRVTIAP